MKTLVCFTALLLLSACATPTTYGPKASREEQQAEEFTQQKMVDEAAEDGGVPRPWRKRKGITNQFERVADKIDKEGAKLCQEMGLPQRHKTRCYFYFELSRSRELNAHADGKSIVMYTGLMRFLQDDDEVGIILGHELAHNLMSHKEGLKKNELIGRFFGALLDGAAAGAAGGRPHNDFEKAGAAIGALTYSVEFEQEADYIGLYIAARAGYDITKAPGIWRRMTLEEPEGLFGEITHPANGKRSATLQKTVEEIEYKRKNHLPLIPEFKNPPKQSEEPSHG